MNLATNCRFGKHYGPPLAGGQGRRAEAARRLGFDTIGAQAYSALQEAGIEPRHFGQVSDAFWLAPFPLATPWHEVEPTQ